jgi:hypothetical protein
LRREIEKLPEGYRRPIVMHFFGELDYQQVSEALGCSRATVKMRVHRGLKRLRERLAFLGLLLSDDQLLRILTSDEMLPEEMRADVDARVLEGWGRLLECPEKVPFRGDPFKGGLSFMTRLTIGTLAAGFAVAAVLTFGESRGADANSPPSKAKPSRADAEGKDGEKRTTQSRPDPTAAKKKVAPARAANGRRAAPRDPSRAVPRDANVRDPLTRKVSLEFVDLPLRDALAELTTLTGVKFRCRPENADWATIRVNLRLKDMSLKLALDWITRLCGVTWSKTEEGHIEVKGKN